MRIDRLSFEVEQALLLWISNVDSARMERCGVCVCVKNEMSNGRGLTPRSAVRVLLRRPSSGAIRHYRRTSESSRYGSSLPRGHN